MIKKYIFMLIFVFNVFALKYDFCLPDKNLKILFDTKESHFMGKGTSGSVYSNKNFAFKKISFLQAKMSFINKEIKMMDAFQDHFDVASIHKFGLFCNKSDKYNI